MFGRWGKVPENLAANVIKELRKKKGLPPEIPQPSKFIEEI
jgi:elongation factor 2